MNVRDAEAAEIDQLARIWYDAWQDAHAQILPAELIQIRTLDSFRDRLQATLLNTRVVGASGEPVGFCIVAGDELYLRVGTGARYGRRGRAGGGCRGTHLHRVARLG